MGHIWVIDVLEDLCIYAAANGLEETARSARQALNTARAEILHMPLEHDTDFQDDIGL